MLGLAAALLVQPVLAGPFEDAVAARERCDYATALRLLRPLADQGNADAQSALGEMYSRGQGVPKDRTEADKWYKKSVDRRIATGGNPFDAFGTDVGPSPQVEWQKGEAAYQKGDIAMALNFWNKWALLGYADAENSLGMMYAAGNGLPQNYELAHMWLNLAAAQGNAGAARNRDQVAIHMTPDQIFVAQERARVILADQQAARQPVCPEQ